MTKYAPWLVAMLALGAAPFALNAHLQAQATAHPEKVRCENHTDIVMGGGRPAEGAIIETCRIHGFTIRETITRASEL